MRALLLSDTHGHHHDLDIPAKGYTLAIHTGDFSNNAYDAEDFLNWYSKLPCKHKILIPGNHDTCVESDEHKYKALCKELGVTLLINQSTIIDGIKFYGTPYVPRFFDWAYMKSDGIALEKEYSKIPDDTEVLLCHGPMERVLDEVSRGYVGSYQLRKRIDNLTKLRYFVFGHIHECGGREHMYNGVRCINASAPDKWFNLRKPKIINLRKA